MRAAEPYGVPRQRQVEIAQHDAISRDAGNHLELAASDDPIKLPTRRRRSRLAERVFQYFARLLVSDANEEPSAPHPERNQYEGNVEDDYRPRQHHGAGDVKLLRPPHARDDGSQHE